MQDSAHLALAGFLHLLSRHEHIRPILRRVLRLPSLWSVIWHMGVDIRIIPRFGLVELAPAKLAGEAAKAWYLPLEIQANGSVALAGSMKVVAPQSPRTLCAGVVSVVFMKPGEPGTYLTMQLMAAKR